MRAAGGCRAYTGGRSCGAGRHDRVDDDGDARHHPQCPKWCRHELLRQGQPPGWSTVSGFDQGNGWFKLNTGEYAGGYVSLSYLSPVPGTPTASTGPTTPGGSFHGTVVKTLIKQPGQLGARIHPRHRPRAGLRRAQERHRAGERLQGTVRALLPHRPRLSPALQAELLVQEVRLSARSDAWGEQPQARSGGRLP